MCSEVAMAVRPRYHVATGARMWRPPALLYVSWAECLGSAAQCKCSAAHCSTSVNSGCTLLLLTQSIHTCAGPCAGKRCFYARPPYLNADLGAGSHVTRFVSLAEVGGGV